MTISRRCDGDLITSTDPTAGALRAVLRSDLTTIPAAEHHREIERVVPRERTVTAAPQRAGTEPVRRPRGLRRALATALVRLAHRLADDVFEPMRPTCSTSPD
jgi:hypothetical protein